MGNKNTIVISAFPCCGKSWCFENLKDKYDMSDSDSSNFSWIKNVDENGNNIKIRNPDFPNNYIGHIKNLIGQKDFVFVSSHDVVRKALKDSNIPYFLVYPDNTSNNKCVWTERLHGRGSSSDMIKFIIENWDDFIEQMKMEDYPFHYILGTENNQLFLNETVLGDIQYVWENIKDKNDAWKDNTFSEIPVSPLKAWYE